MRGLAIGKVCLCSGSQTNASRTSLETFVLVRKGLLGLHAALSQKVRGTVSPAESAWKAAKEMYVSLIPHGRDENSSVKIRHLRVVAAYSKGCGQKELGQVYTAGILPFVNTSGQYTRSARWPDIWGAQRCCSHIMLNKVCR